jgi:hypothetical protein
MAIVEIACRCGHHGYVAARALPGVLRCHTCDHAEFFRRGCQTIRSHYLDVDDDDAWARYDGPPQAGDQAQACAGGRADVMLTGAKSPISLGVLCQPQGTASVSRLHRSAISGVDGQRVALRQLR